MVGCLFARAVYTEEQLAECLMAVGFDTLSGSISKTSEYIRALRWKVRAKTGFNPENFTIPKRFYQVETWKGQIDKNYLDSLKMEYGKRIEAIIAGS
jgi:aldehyde:ferredoxin oxidoreductase